MLLAVKRLQDLQLAIAGPACAERPEDKTSAIGQVRSSFAYRTLGQGAGGLDVLRIVQEHECLEWRGRGQPLDRAHFPAGGVEGEHGRRGRCALPERVKTASVLDPHRHHGRTRCWPSLSRALRVDRA